jgi:hypothetical protein
MAAVQWRIASRSFAHGTKIRAEPSDDGAGGPKYALNRADRAWKREIKAGDRVGHDHVRASSTLLCKCSATEIGIDDARAKNSFPTVFDTVISASPSGTAKTMQERCVEPTMVACGPMWNTERHRCPERATWRKRERAQDGRGAPPPRVAAIASTQATRSGDPRVSAASRVPVTAAG